MVWGYITVEGIGYLTKIKGHLNADLYCQILRDELMKSLKYYDLDTNKIIFQQDNDLKHTSNMAKNCLQELGLKVLQWPAQSPDLNPIEHFWSHLKCHLHAWLRQLTGMLELWERVEEELEGISQGVVINLIESMPHHIAAVLKVKGGMMNY